MVELLRKNGASVKRWVRGDGSYLAANDPGISLRTGKVNGYVNLHAGPCASAFSYLPWGRMASCAGLATPLAGYQELYGFCENALRPRRLAVRFTDTLRCCYNPPLRSRSRN